MTTPVAAAEAALAADRRHGDPAIWITRVHESEVLARARTLEREGAQGRKLWGVPFAVKDNIDIAGMPTTAACPGYERVPERTAPAVQRLLAWCMDRLVGAEELTGQEGGLVPDLGESTCHFRRTKIAATTFQNSDTG